MGHEGALAAVARGLIARRGRSRMAGEDLGSGEARLLGAVRDKSAGSFDYVFHGKTPSSHAVWVSRKKDSLRLLLLWVVYLSSVTGSDRIVEAYLRLLNRRAAARAPPCAKKCLRSAPAAPDTYTLEEHHGATRV
jgi:hypothetical protein